MTSVAIRQTCDTHTCRQNIQIHKINKPQLRHLAIVDRVSELAIYCNWIGDYPNCHYRAFYPGTNKSRYRNPQSSTGLNSGSSPEEKEEGLYGARGGQGHDRGTHRNSWPELVRTHELWLSQQLGSLHGTDPGPLHVCNSCVVWSVSVRLLAVRSGLIPGT